MAFGALARGTDEVGNGLLDLGLRALTIDEEGRENERECNDHGDKDRTKRQSWPGSALTQLWKAAVCLEGSLPAIVQSGQVMTALKSLVAHFLYEEGGTRKGRLVACLGCCAR